MYLVNMKLTDEEYERLFWIFDKLKGDEKYQYPAIQSDPITSQSIYDKLVRGTNKIV
jgi:hypothetical protein